MWSSHKSFCSHPSLCFSISLVCCLWALQIPPVSNNPPFKRQHLSSPLTFFQFNLVFQQITLFFLNEGIPRVLNYSVLHSLDLCTSTQQLSFLWSFAWPVRSLALSDFIGEGTNYGGPLGHVSAASHCVCVHLSLHGKYDMMCFYVCVKHSQYTWIPFFSFQRGHGFKSVHFFLCHVDTHTYTQITFLFEGKQAEYWSTAEIPNQGLRLLGAPYKDYGVVISSSSCNLSSHNLKKRSITI